MSSSARSGLEKWDKTECDVCCGIGAILTTATSGQFMKGSVRGCLLCKILSRAIRIHAPGRPTTEEISLCHGLGIYEMVIGTNGEDRVKISVYGHDRPEAPLRFAYEHKGIKPPEAKSVADVTGNTSSPAAMAKIRGWIEECDRSHGDCRLATAQQPLPTRVLDVGSATNPLVRLHESTETEAEPYICLSHCWGGHQPLKTEKSTIDARKQSIDWDDLPRTFQDAVTMTRELNIRYLWIDSLCIVQDDVDDWQRESAKMHTIYQNGYLTLAASGSDGPDGGLFRNDWDLNGQLIRTRRKILHVDSKQDYPLMRRGWVFQERVLSHRVLHFSTAELAWECMEDNDCECGYFHHSLGLGTYELAPKERYRPVERMKRWLMFVWWKIVADYSRMQLTMDKDIFPALSGLAQLQKAARGVTYYAGLWSDTLVYDLLWRVPKHWNLPVVEFQYKTTARPDEWRAPTWSWASVKSAVEYEELAGFDSKLTSCEVEVVPAAASETGQLASAALTVSGMLVEVTVRKPRTDEKGQSHTVAFLDFGEDLSLRLEEDYDIWEDPVAAIDEGETLFCLLVGKWFKADSDENADDKLWYMVLRAVDQELDLYERVGVVTVPIKEDDFEKYKDFLCGLTQTEDIRIF